MIDIYPNCPFQPAHSVRVQNFTGRKKELKNIIKYIPTIINYGETGHFFVIGKRAMGKTSFVKYLEKYIEDNFNMIPIYVNNDGYNTVDDLIELLIEALIKKIDYENSGKRILKDFLNNIEEINIEGSGIKLKDNHPELINNIKRNFTDLLINISNKLNEKNGIFIIIDDINGLSEDNYFPSWYKSFVDTVDNSGAHVPIAFTLVSYPENFYKLCSHNESFSRIFNLIEITELKDEEVNKFFKKTFNYAKINILDNECLEKMTYYTNGTPVVMQQIGESVFWRADVEGITKENAIDGIKDAVKLIEHRQLKFKLSEIEKNEYKTILIKLGKHHCFNFKKSEFEKNLSPEEQKIFSEFIEKMIEMEIIRQIPKNNQEFEFANRLYYTYFMMLSEIENT